MDVDAAFVEAFRAAARITGVGSDILVDGVALRGTFEAGSPTIGPWADEGAVAPMISLVQADLDDHSLWPLDSPEIEIDSTTYRVLPPAILSNGVVDIFLQES